MYEQMMRPIVASAQKLPPGAPHAMAPETAWAIWAIRIIGALAIWSGLANLFFMLKGTAADIPVVEEYGFEQPLELEQEAGDD